MERIDLAKFGKETGHLDLFGLSRSTGLLVAGKDHEVMQHHPGDTEPVVMLALSRAKTEPPPCMKLSKGWEYSNARRLCRACNVPSDSSDIPGYECQPFLSHPIQQLWATYHRNGDERALRASLHEKSLHFCENALCECDFGNQPMLPLPHDMMHISDGICKPIFELIVDGLTPKERKALDELHDRLFKNLKNSRSYGASTGQPDCAAF